MKLLYQGKKVNIDKVQRIRPGQPGYGRKKFQVYTIVNKRIKKIMFGDPNMTIKKNNPARKKSFNARHKCQTARNKATPRYWSCLMWNK